jgi:glucokinase
LSEHLPYLVADIGGTNTRIGLGAIDGAPRSVQSFRNDTLRDVRDVLTAALRNAPAQPRYGVIAAAGPVEGDRIHLTNRNWTLERADLEQSLGLERLILVNDFAAMAHSVAALAGEELVAIGGSSPNRGGNLLVCGPGTGFGVAMLLQTSRGPFAAATEAGHMRLGATTDEEARVFRKLANDPRGIAVEELLSGRGLIALHRALNGEAATTDEVIRDANSSRPSAAATMTFFMRVFGRVVGDLTLACNARGGVYLGGGIGRALAPLYPTAPFRAAFEAHPPYEAQLRAVPIHVIMHESPGLIGALQIARSEFPATPPRH